MNKTKKDMYPCGLKPSFDDEDIIEGFCSIIPENGKITFTGDFVPLMKIGEKVTLECYGTHKFSGSVTKSLPDELTVGSLMNPPQFELLKNAEKTVGTPVDIDGLVLCGRYKKPCIITYLSAEEIRFNCELTDNSKFKIKFCDIVLKLRVAPESFLFGVNARYICKITGVSDNAAFLKIIRNYHYSWLEPFSEVLPNQQGI